MFSPLRGGFAAVCGLRLGEPHEPIVRRVFSNQDCFRESLGMLLWSLDAPPLETVYCRAVTRSVCPPLTIVAPGSHPPNRSISFHLVNSHQRVLALLSVPLFSYRLPLSVLEHSRPVTIILSDRPSRINVSLPTIWPGPRVVCETPPSIRASRPADDATGPASRPAPRALSWCPRRRIRRCRP